MNDRNDKRVLIIIPTFNESENIERLLSAIDKIGLAKLDILFVDDNSPDGTGKLIERIRLSRPNVFIIHRRRKEGLGVAYKTGFKYAVEKGYDYVFEMDADLSHNPESVIGMLKKLEDFDVVVGSRFMGDIYNINATPFRIFMSISASLYMRLMLGLKCRDTMAGFIGYKREVLKSLDFDHFLAKGYAFQAEIKFKCQRNGFKIIEMPTVFKNRGLGESKVKRKDMLEALLLPWRLK